MYKILVEMPAATTQYLAEFPLDNSSGKSSVVKITYCSWESKTNVMAGSDHPSQKQGLNFSLLELNKQSWKNYSPGSTNQNVSHWVGLAKYSIPPPYSGKVPKH